MTKRVVMVCDFPPPIHGGAIVSLRMRERFLMAGHRVLSIDTAPVIRRRGMSHYLYRIRKLGDIWRLLRVESEDTIIYCSVNAHWGVFIDLFVALIARRIGAALWLHHHSFRYLEGVHPMHRAAFFVHRRHAHHIVLCERMKELLCANYNVKNENVCVFSNSNFIEPSKSDNVASAKQGNLITVGFLSNITEEKGISDFMRLTDLLQDLEAHFKIGGPIVDDKYHWLTDIEKSSNGRICWVGSLNEAAKEHFLNDIDVLIFPTRYRNEAEPLVIYEAMAAGVVVIAYSRGCIREMVEWPHVIAADCTEIARTVRQLVLERPSRAQVLESFRTCKARQQRQFPVTA